MYAKIHVRKRKYDSCTSCLEDYILALFIGRFVYSLTSSCFINHILKDFVSSITYRKIDQLLNILLKKFTKTRIRKISTRLCVFDS